MPAILVTLLVKGAEVALTMIVENVVGRWLKRLWHKHRKPR